MAAIAHYPNCLHFVVMLELARSCHERDHDLTLSFAATLSTVKTRAMAAFRQPSLTSKFGALKSARC